jgi:hypothetical protein
VTHEEWRTLKPGDVVVEAASGARRVVVRISRRPAERNMERPRTWVTFESLRAPGRYVSYCNNDDVRRERWRLERTGSPGE